MTKNTSLNNAGIAKQDEFYTMLTDVEKELSDTYLQKHMLALVL